MFQNEVDITISKEQLAGMPPVSFPGKITVVDTCEVAEKAIADLRNAGMIGFDTETKPSFRKGQCNTVSLIQLSTDDHCYLFRIKHTGMLEPLIALLEDESVTKIGLSLRDDFHVLHVISEFTPGGFIDLQDMVHDHQIHDISLQKIYGIIFGERISKSQRLSNWEAKELTPGQQQYASIDAWACLKIYKYLINGQFKPNESPYHQPELLSAHQKDNTKS
ncbi:MAG: 3'-5' exonuclease domain-containing protein 2 [Muribaculaceae bacterium]|nr:3'-5' exonuclease domain-containing protein 2 [Muribaculaceae bacterium]